MPSSPTPTDDASGAPRPWLHLTSTVVVDLLDELRLCSQAYLRALVSASVRCETADRAVYDQLARTHASEHHVLFGSEDQAPDQTQRSPQRLATHAWIAARAVLPEVERDGLVARRIASLARDLAIRGEELMLYDLPRPIARRMVAFVDANQTAFSRLSGGLVAVHVG